MNATATFGGLSSRICVVLEVLQCLWGKRFTAVVGEEDSI